MNEEETRAYYDDFARTYEDHRAPNEPEGYHALIDDLEVEVVERFGAGKDVLECGCGTGLILSRVARFARSARGVDLSPGMLARARERGLSVEEASVVDLPFDADTFDVTYAFKVLAHVPDLGRAVAEMVRVTRPGGVVLIELYNGLSLRGIVKRLSARRITAERSERDVYTRFDSPWVVRRVLPPGVELVGARGVRIVTPVAGALGWPIAGPLLRRVERRLADTPASLLGGFYIAFLRKSAA